MSNFTSLQFFLPEVALSATAVALVILAVFNIRRTGTAASLAIAGITASLILALKQWGVESPPLFWGLLTLDHPSEFFKLLFEASAIAVIILSMRSREIDADIPEYYALVAGMTLGMNLLAEAENILMIYLALEFVSLQSYLLTAYVRGSARSAEAGLKYVLFGSAASGVFLYGASLFYGSTGSLDINSLSLFADATPILTVGGVMMLAGFLYKIAAVPMHAWCPDAYEGAPIPVAAFLSVAPKAAGFAVLMRVMSSAGLHVGWPEVLAVISAVTMTFGNLVAITQSNVKRLLAYSSIAHAGYMLIGVACATDRGMESVYFYFIAYALMNIGAFAVVEIIANRFGAETISSFDGLSRRGAYGSLMSVVMMVFLLSLTGIPPFIGFVGKFYIFSAAIDAKLYWLAIVGIINSVISLYYYMRIAKAMFFSSSADHEHITADGVLLPALVCIIATAVTILGLVWQRIADIASAI